MRVLLAVYSVADGDIVRKVSCLDTVAELQAGEGQAVLLIERGTEFCDTTHFIDLTGPEPVLALKPEE